MENDELCQYDENNEVIIPEEAEYYPAIDKLEVIEGVSSRLANFLETREHTKQLTEKVKLASQMVSAKAKVGQKIIDDTYVKQMRDMDNLEKVLDHAIKTNNTQLMTTVMEQMNRLTGMSIAQEYVIANSQSANSHSQPEAPEELPWGDL